MKILVLDNYDSFTYNLVQYIEEILKQEVDVFRNDEISLDKIEEYDTIILSPGPGLPKDAGILLELIRRYAATKLILGVCLGHQAIAEVFGGKLQNLKNVFHGIATEIEVTDSSEILFKDLPKKIEVGRYHSWIVEKKSLPDCLKITSVDYRGEIMSIRHTHYTLYGVQFHPESILTPKGKQILSNFLTSVQIEKGSFKFENKHL